MEVGGEVACGVCYVVVVVVVVATVTIDPSVVTTHSTTVGLIVSEV